METKVKYNLYIDESGDSSFKSGRWLCLCGILMKESQNEISSSLFSQFKTQYGIDGKVLHLADIRNNKKSFSFLAHKPEIKTKFLKDLINVISKIDFKIIAITIDKEFLSKKYSTPVDPYHYALTMMIETLVPFLIGSNGACKISAEARNARNLDIPLNEHFKEICKKGTRWGHAGCVKLTSQKIKTSITSENIKFFNKPSIIQYGVHGLEISDLLCDPVMQLIKSRIFNENKIDRPKFNEPKIPQFTKDFIIEGIIKDRIIGINWQP